MDLGTGDGRAVLARASAQPGELVVGIDASAAGMVRASRRAAASLAHGGLPNARFLVAGLESLPEDLSRYADLVTISFPWGSLLAAAVGQAPALTGRIVRLLRPGGTLRMIVSASPRDAGRGLAEVDLGAMASTYEELGMWSAASRAATSDDLAAAHSSWAKRLATSPRRSAWLTELRLPPAPAGRA
ncbi:MAG: class I SAM-dependent methyltransferase [Chloroflexota bacterium]